MTDEPGAPFPELRISPATKEDLAELLVLQRCCWTQEAIVNDTLDLPALRETLDEVAEWAVTWQVWCVRRHGRLIAAVRANANGPTWEIGRLMVAPDQAGHGLGRWLLAYTERKAPPETSTYSLFTGARSERNIALYQRAGYRIAERLSENGIGVVHLLKALVTA